MRITNRNQMSTFMSRMNNNLSQLTKSNNKMSSQRKFDKAWENVADATRTMRVRRLIRDNEHSLTNIRDVQGRMNASEDNLGAINKILEQTLDRSVQGLNATYDESDRQKMAAELENLQRQTLSLMNGQYADEFLFSAAGGATKGQPFQMGTMTMPELEYGNLWQTDANGNAIFDTDVNGNKIPRPILVNDGAGNMVPQQGWKTKTQPVMGKDAGGNNIITGYQPVTKTVTGLMYNGMPVDMMKEDPTTKKIVWQGPTPGYETSMAKNPSYNPFTMNGSEIKWTEIPFNKNNFIDIGLGFKLKGNSASPETSMQYTYSGAELFGVGRNENGISNNVYTLLGEICDSLNTNNMDQLGQQLDQLRVCRDRLMVGITQIGTSAKFSEDMAGILENDTLVLKTTQTDLEAIDLAEESINNKDFEMSWMVTLQLGSKVLPTSLFDFMR